MFFIDENIPFLPKCLSKIASVELFNGRKLNNNNLLDSDNKFLFVRSTTKVNQDLLDGTNVEFVGTATSGIDHIDLNYLKANNIYFASAQGSNANSVAEYVIYSTLKWANNYNIDLKTKTIGIVGFGNIGSLLARYAKHIFKEVLINDPPLKEKGFIFPKEYKYLDLNDLCANSDIISNHVPLTKNQPNATYYLFGKKQLELIKNNSLLIHSSRGGVIEEKGLINYLEKFQLVIDVFENEPLHNSQLAKRAILATPHIAGYSYDGKLRGVKMMTDAFSKYSGKAPDLEELNKEMSAYFPANIAVFSDLKKLFVTLKETRKLEEDFINFLSISEKDEEARKQAFDLQRKNYPKRREFL